MNQGRVCTRSRVRKTWMIVVGTNRTVTDSAIDMAYRQDSEQTPKSRVILW